ncbi:hypothetical protein DFH06DRAFT_1202878 [Mycena polygramma]|nr:hypothetical protein DFH06DRAFT_1202878 [Mycena polygramma]
MHDQRVPECLQLPSDSCYPEFQTSSPLDASKHRQFTPRDLGADFHRAVSSRCFGSEVDAYRVSFKRCASQDRSGDALHPPVARRCLPRSPVPLQRDIRSTDRACTHIDIPAFSTRRSVGIGLGPTRGLGGLLWPSRFDLSEYTTTVYVSTHTH